MLREFSQFVENKYSLFPKSDEVAADILVGLIYAHPVFVAQRAGEVVGCIAGINTPHVFNPDLRTLTELFWWVKPKERNSRAGLLLLEALLSWGRRNSNLIVVSLENISPVKPETLEKRGLRRHETNFILEV